MECWQSYREADGVRSQEAFQAGDTALVRRLLEEEALGDQPLRDEVRSRNLQFTRVRLLSYPLTDYLHYEMINYEVRSRLGEGALPHHTNQEGQPVWFSGGRLAANLTLPKLRHRWSAHREGARPTNTPSTGGS
ncbi:DUF6879 family protein [Actinomadura sediminis]|uniref:DUF6879 family protein n=1 Tax=Actinomadura sediminis TaxID=1038904 RepID=A0ABW3EKC8_9ACTN